MTILPAPITTSSPIVMPGRMRALELHSHSLQCRHVHGHYQRGVVSAEESKELQTHSWYAPAANTHRSPMGGRNFEYYSEDPLLGGMAMAYTARGAEENGLTCMLKHFAGNDQETNRTGIETYMSERAYREIYLKPFEYAVKAGANGIMSAFNRLNTTWCGASRPLLLDLLRCCGQAFL
mgnify:FL=1